MIGIRAYRWPFAAMGLWFVLAVVALIARQLGAEVSWWRALHVPTLGVLGTAIFTFSTFFVQTLTRAPKHGGLGLRLGLLQGGGVVLTVADPGQGWSLWCDAGATLVLAALTWHVLALWGMRRCGMGGPLAPLVGFYLAAGLLGGVGIILVILAGRDISASSGLIAAHARLMVYGLASLTVLGTVPTLLPTMAGVRAQPVPRRRVAWMVCFLLAGLLATAALLIIENPRAAGWTLLVTTAVGLRSLVPTVAGLQYPRAASLGAGSAWLLVGMALDGVGLVRGLDPREVTAGLVVVLLGAGLGQLVASALGHLIPVLLGRRPSPTSMAWLGVVLMNLGGAWALVGQPTSVSVALVILGAVGHILAALLRPRGDGYGWAIVAVIVAGVLVIGAQFSGQDADDLSDGDTQVRELRIEDMAFIPNHITVEPGQKVVLRITNQSALIHDILVADTRSDRIYPYTTVDVAVPALEEDTLAWCTVAGHRQHGMTLMIDVAEGVATSAGPSPAQAPPAGGITRR